MPLINDENIYPITDLLDGATVIGSLPNGNTVQFSISGIMDYIVQRLDFVHYDKASKAGQTIVGNDPNFPETQNDNINGGDKYFGTIVNFPPNADSDINFITRLRSR